MLYAWINGNKRPPLKKGEKAVCRDCGGTLLAVMPVENVRHWRHKAGDCDSWSEAEGPWHIWWKQQFDISCQEISLRDESTGELHRADILVGQNTPLATVVELQHSNISEQERDAREAFYMRAHRMFWLVHIHEDDGFRTFNFDHSLDLKSRVINYRGKEFAVMSWIGRSSQFIEKWKRAKAHVFFQRGPHIYYFAGARILKSFDPPLKKGEFALCPLSASDFVRAANSESRKVIETQDVS